MGITEKPHEKDMQIFGTIKTYCKYEAKNANAIQTYAKI